MASRRWKSTDAPPECRKRLGPHFSHTPPAFLTALMWVVATLNAPRGAGAQSLSQIASGTNVTGVAQRFYLYPPSCESDPCISACTSLLVNSFSRAPSGSFVTYVNLFVLPGTVPAGCDCATTCSASLAPTFTNGVADTFDQNLIKYYASSGALNLTMTCNGGVQLKSYIVGSFAPTLRQIDIEFPAGFAGSDSRCLGSYAILQLSATNPPSDWFLGLGFNECVDPPLGVAQQVQLTPEGCSADPCLAACSGKANGLLYFNPRGQFKYYYQWILAPSVGATIPTDCSCEKYNCMFTVDAPAGLTQITTNAALISNFLSASAPLLSGDGAPFYCVDRNYSAQDGRPPDFKVASRAIGQRRGVAVQFGRGCSAIYAVTAGYVFNVSQRTSVPFIPIAPATPPPDELSETARTVIIVVVVVIGTFFLCMCCTLYYMYRRERRGEPLFTKLDEVELEGGWQNRSSRVEPSPS